QKELKEIDAKILAAETAIKTAKTRLEDPSIATNISKLLENQKLVDAEKTKLDSLMERWEELEAKKNKV
ncbi:MAG TPA: ABC transporter C-terminal domain-containing protein, partial [bacterium]|nr:ABC transporter C-terminal domain-containing protein [bacterium]